MPGKLSPGDGPPQLFRPVLRVSSDMTELNLVTAGGGKRVGRQALNLFDHFHDDHEPDICAWLARAKNE